MRGHRWADDAASYADMKRTVPKSVGLCYETIETRMLKGPWVMGDDYTIADPYLFTLAQWLEDDGVDPARIPRVMAHRARMAARPQCEESHRRGTRHIAWCPRNGRSWRLWDMRTKYWNVCSLKQSGSGPRAAQRR